MYTKTVLENGITVITHRMPKMQSVALGIWIKVGGRYESVENKGISHYLEHLLFKGSKKYSCQEIKESIEGVGGALNGFTSEEATCYLVKLPSRHWDLAFDILSDMVANPLLLKNDIQKEQTVILEEIKMYKDLPQSYVYDLLDELMWPGQALGMSVLGSVESVSRVDRKGLSWFKQNHYGPSNIVISAAGLLEHDVLLKRVKKVFLGQSGTQKNQCAEALQQQTRSHVKLYPKETEQTHVALGFHSFKRGHPLKHAVGLLHVILGGNMSSRLFNELREKRGLAYEIGTQVKRFQDTGAFVVHAGIDNKKVNEALVLIIKELKRIRHALVSDDEFRRAKEFYLGQLMLALEDTLDHMLWIGESTLAMDKTYTLEDVFKEVRQVKRQDILQAAQEIFQQRCLNLALIGPGKDQEADLLKKIQLG
ncbi:MAG: pitrilysin family protein [Candidatus Omnitrophota bacterium]|jgi:predicted Zn-dependent peptidase